MELRPDQEEAVARICAGLRDAPPGGDVRGQNIAACGTGKIRVQLRVMEELEAKLTLVLVPTLHLIAQVQTEWARNRTREYASLTICGDVQVLDGRTERASEYELRPTTNPEEIAKFLTRAEERVVFCTYQSTARVMEAQLLPGSPEFDLVLCDEAHRTAGTSDAPFTVALDPSKIRARRRLFSTATPKILSLRMRERGMLSMDDASLYGEVLYHLSFAEAIERQLLLDYEVVVMVTDEESIPSLYLLGGREVSSGDATELSKILMLLRSMEMYGLHRVLGFVNRVERAKRFAEGAQQAAQKIALSSRVWAGAIDGTSSMRERRGRLHKFETADSSAVLFNARCLAEGADFPWLDGVAFLDARRSVIDITQAIGRVLRLPAPQGTPSSAKILVPLFLREGETLEDALETSEFDHLVDVFRALRTLDTSFLSNSLEHTSKRPSKDPKENTPKPPAFRVATDDLLLEFADNYAPKKGEIIRYDGSEVVLADGRKFKGAHQLQAAISEGTLTAVKKEDQSSTPRKQVQVLNFSSRHVSELWEHIVVRAVNSAFTCRAASKPELTVEQVIQAVTKYTELHGEPPHTLSGDASREFGYSETWRNINLVGVKGCRGLPKGFTLKEAIKASHLSHFIKQPLTLERVREAVRRYAEDHGGCPPHHKSGDASKYFGYKEDWKSVYHAGVEGLRGLQKGTYLKAIAKELGFSAGPPPLTVEGVTQAIRDFAEKNEGRAPTCRSGDASEYFGRKETWRKIAGAGHRGYRGLPKGFSLSEVARQLGFSPTQKSTEQSSAQPRVEAKVVDSEEVSRVLLVLRSAPDDGYSRREVQLGTKLTETHVINALAHLARTDRVRCQKNRYMLATPLEGGITAEEKKRLEAAATEKGWSPLQTRKRAKTVAKRHAFDPERPLEEDRD